jgi:hypothetical protein
MRLIPAVDRVKIDGAEKIVTWAKLILINSVPGWLKLGCALQEMEGVAPFAAYPQRWNGGSKRAIAIVYHVRCILAGAAGMCTVTIVADT